jgi:hypothetical protein
MVDVDVEVPVADAPGVGREPAERVGEPLRQQPADDGGNDGQPETSTRGRSSPTPPATP